MQNISIYHAVEKDQIWVDSEGMKRITYILMDYVQGNSLDVLAKDLSQNHFAYILLQIIRIVESLHRHGFAHCDIKFDNIMVSTTDFTVVLVDFGSAQNVKDVPQATGTLAFRAPELVDGSLGELIRGDKVDLFSIGALMLHCAMIKYTLEKEG